jgi:Ca2+-binding RTX toxin-like protein
MVFKLLLGGSDGDILNDTVYAGYEFTPYYYLIRSWRGDDVIDLRDANSGSSFNIFAGSGNDIVYGGSGDDSYYDQSGNDRVNFGAGDDYVRLGSGDDTVWGGTGTDSLSFSTRYDDNGNYVNNSQAVTVDLALTTQQNFGIFGKDKIKDFERVEGGSGNDKLYGTSGDNLLQGNGGNDYLKGRGGNDTLFGLAGSDTLYGGSGNDTLDVYDLSGTARDYIRFASITDSGTGASSIGVGAVDYIVTFDRGGLSTDDKIDLSRIDAKASTAYNNTFVFRGLNGTFASSSGEVFIEELDADGNGTTDSVIRIDNDSDSSVEMTIVVKSVTGLTADDFIL